MSDVAAAAPGRRFSFRTFVICAALLAVFATLALLAALSKSPTYDEPLHALSAWLALHYHDFRVDPEDPPLWKYWAALPNGRDALHATDDPKMFASVADDIRDEWRFTVDMLYRVDDNAAKSDDFIQRSRAMMLALGVVLGGLIAWWGWKLGGATVAITATACFALDPNFLAHSALVKNDVVTALCGFGLSLAVWRAGLRLTIYNFLAIGLLCAAVVNVKFSGLLFGPIVAVLMIVRALHPSPWVTFWRPLKSRTDKLVVAIIMLFLWAFVSYGGTWACYCFRFGPSPDPSVLLNQKRMSVYTAMAELNLKHPGTFPTNDEVDAWKPSTMTRTILALDEIHFLPQAWLNGLYYTYQSALVRKTYLMGGYSLTGWWYYFPVAMALKTPLATLLAAVGAMGFGVVIFRKRERREQLGKSETRWWSAACLLIPSGIYMLSAMRSNLNLGLRHVLPVYPFVYIGIGLALAEAMRRWRKPVRIAAAILAAGLAVESLVAFPNFIPFFNVAAGGSRGGFYMLGDSNLDWGQDLKLLVQWQQDHPHIRLYSAYFGLADPDAYKLNYINMPGGYSFGPPPQPSSEPGVLAISATVLQGIYTDHDLRSDYAKLHDVKPIDVLGGSIYLYKWPPPQK